MSIKKINLNLKDKKIGKLKVIDKDIELENKKNKRKRKYWKCICDCGNHISVEHYNLLRGQKSCSICSKKESKNRKYNNYNLNGKYGIGYSSSDPSIEFYFDLEDYDKIKDYCWNVRKTKNRKGYVSTDTKNGKIEMHRFLMGFPKNMDVDHINGLPYDNRKENLRICTHQQNIMNSKLSKNNKSGKTGVCWVNREEKWLATITINNKQKFLGYFDNFDDAVKAREEAEEKYFGEYRRK